MSTNVATNFPPQTYSSQFFLNVINDEAGVSTSSKKRAKNAADGAETSNAVIDCFISTMFCLYNFKHIIIISLALQISQCTDTSDDIRYTCVEAHFPTVRLFETIKQYQGNSIPFDPKQNYVSFNQTTITTLSKNIFITHDSNHIRKLDLSNKRIEIIERGAFNQLFCVKYLLLQDNLIERITDGTFEGLNSLEELYLNGNNIANIEASTFNYIPNLLRLDLSSNKISILSFESFEHLKNLYLLNLSHNRITYLGLGLFVRTKHLRKLNLSYNRITLSETALQQLINLDTLDISYNKMSFIPDRVFQNTESLIELNLSGNNLNDLEIKFLPAKLERIFIENNHWQCDKLQEIVNNLQKQKIGIVIDRKARLDNITITDLGCIKGDISYPAIVPTTRIPWRKITTTTAPEISTSSSALTTTTEESKDTKNSKDVQVSYLTQQDKDIILSTVNNLKIVVIILIVLIVLFHTFDIMIRTNAFDRFRRRSTENFPFSSHSSNYSLPLLQR